MTEEIEAKLAVVGPDPESVLNELASLTRLGPYRLGRTEDLLLDDTYYDTAAFDLLRQGVALRIRRIGSLILFCMKSGEVLDADGVARRREEERVWSSGCRDLISELGRAPTIDTTRFEFHGENPAKTLEKMGLFPIQHRLTERRTVESWPERGPGDRPAAHICLDRVIYELPPGAVVHMEIEVEASCLEDRDHVGKITRLLSEYLGAKAFFWPHNKLITGIALARLPGPGTRETRTLSMADYDAISAIALGMAKGAHGPA